MCLLLIQVFDHNGTFLRLLGNSSASGGSFSRASAGNFAKPAAVAIASMRSDGSVVQLHEQLDDTIDGKESSNTITNTLVLVSDAASHRIQIFK